MERVDLRVRDGEVLALVGPDPAERLLVIELVPRRRTPTNGRVLVGGTPAAALPEHEVPRMLAPRSLMLPSSTDRAGGPG